jgi:sodium-dependent phosphate transporter
VTIIKKDPTVKWWMFIMGPALFKRPVVEHADQANVPNYAVVQDDDETSSKSVSGDSEKGVTAGDITPVETDEKHQTVAEVSHVQKTHKELIAEGEAKLNAKLCQRRGPMGWAMRTLRDNPMGI